MSGLQNFAVTSKLDAACTVMLQLRITSLLLLLFTGEGAPDYAALYNNRSIKPLPFPEPIPSLTPYKLDPETGYVPQWNL